MRNDEEENRMARHSRNLGRICPRLLAIILLIVAALPLCAQTSASTPPLANAGVQPIQRDLTSGQTPGTNQASESPHPILLADERQARIEADTKMLYKLCAELRAEVGRTYKDSLSLTVLKKAEEIERLAKSLKVLMNKEAAAKR
jgi:hypothetical protein